MDYTLLSTSQGIKVKLATRGHSQTLQEWDDPQNQCHEKGCTGRTQLAEMGSSWWFRESEGTENWGKKLLQQLQPEKVGSSRFLPLSSTQCDLNLILKALLFRQCKSPTQGSCTGSCTFAQLCPCPCQESQLKPAGNAVCALFSGSGPKATL